MDVTTIILIGIVLTLGSLIQGAAGFAFGLFAVPMLVLIGLAPYEAIPTVSTCALIQCAIGLRKLHDVVPWKQVLWMSALGIAIQPVGVWLLGEAIAATKDKPHLIRQGFGAILIAVLLLQGLLRPKPREKIHTLWAVPTMVVSGITSGTAGMTAPSIVVWLLAHDWSSKKMRATMWAFFILMIPSNIFFQSVKFGPVVWERAGIAILFLPVVILGSIPGIWLGNKLSRTLLRRIAIALLYLIGIYALVQPMIVNNMSP